jgi:hypothetical protein
LTQNLPREKNSSHLAEHYWGIPGNSDLTPGGGNSSLLAQKETMPENIPNLPGGAMPPKPAEAAKVQPKKETVRINLPPKPTSAPTIKLPTLAPGSPPSSGGTAAPTAAPAAPAAPRAAAPPPPPASRAGAPVTARQPAPPAPASRPSAYVAPLASVRTLDKVLAIVAAVVVLAAVGSTLWLVLGGIEGLTRN